MLNYTLTVKCWRFYLKIEVTARFWTVSFNYLHINIILDNPRHNYYWMDTTDTWKHGLENMLQMYLKRIYKFFSNRFSCSWSKTSGSLKKTYHWCIYFACIKCKVFHFKNNLKTLFIYQKQLNGLTKKKYKIFTHILPNSYNSLNQTIKCE